MPTHHPRPKPDLPAERASAPIPYAADAACDVCGRFGAYRLDERVICGDCLAGCGSCCPEFGREDERDPDA